MARRLLTFVVPALVGVIGFGSGVGTADAPRAPRYVSLGDSLAASMQPDATGHDRATDQGYAEMIWRARAASTPGLRLVKLGRGGETAASMVKSPKPGPSQLDQAVSELRLGSVKLVTIDIGANEVESCRRGSGFDQNCVSRGLGALRANLPLIISRLRAAAGQSVEIVGMNYYNSFLGQWVTGSAGRQLALASVPVERSINEALADIYGAAHVPFANVAAHFHTTELHRYVRSARYGNVPLAVQRTCTWTWACSTRYDDHTNTRGYAVIARAVLGLLTAQSG